MPVIHPSDHEGSQRLEERLYFRGAQALGTTRRGFAGCGVGDAMSQDVRSQDSSITGRPFSPLRASLIAQWVKNLPARQETQVQFLSREDPSPRLIPCQNHASAG